MVDPQMVKMADVQRLISAEDVGVYEAVRIHFLPNNGQAAVRMSGGDNQSVDRVPLQERKDHECAIKTRAFTSSQWVSMVRLWFT